LSGDTVHAIGRRAYEYLFAGRYAEGADEGIDGFIGADANEEVIRCERFRGMDVDVAIVAEVLFEV
jgi:hypothetical protein